MLSTPKSRAKLAFLLFFSLSHLNTAGVNWNEPPALIFSCFICNSIQIVHHGYLMLNFISQWMHQLSKGNKICIECVMCSSNFKLFLCLRQGSFEVIQDAVSDRTRWACQPEVCKEDPKISPRVVPIGTLVWKVSQILCTIVTTLAFPCRRRASDRY